MTTHSTGDKVIELSVSLTEGVNIDWERTRWSIYDGSAAVVQKLGMNIVHTFQSTSNQMGYPVMVEMYLKDGSKPFVGYTSIDIAADDFTPMITSEATTGDTNTILLSAVSSRGSAIQWNSASWNFGDSTPAQYGQSVTHTFSGSKVNKSYTVTLTLTRGTGPQAETKTVTKEIRIGSDAIKPVIKVTKMGSNLVLSAEDSLGTGLILDRSVWLFEGKGDNVNHSESQQDGRTKSWSNTFKTGFSMQNTLTTNLFFGMAGVTLGASFGHDFQLSGGENDSYSKSDSFSSENKHIGAVCRRTLTSSIIAVSLTVYRVNKDGTVEAETIVVNVNTNQSGTYQ